MFEIKVTLTATPDLLAVLTAIAGLGSTKPIASNPADGGSAAASPEEAKKIVDGAKSLDKKPEKPETGEGEKEITIEEVRKVVFEKQDKKAEVKKILDGLEIKSVSLVPADKRAQFIKQVQAL